MEKITNQKCPFCGKSKLSLTEDNQDIPYFGRIFILSMNCEACGVNKTDIESEENKDPVKITFETNSEKDMKVRVVKSAEATVKIPGMRMSMESGPASDGFISNVEGLLNKFEKIIEDQRDSSEDKDVKKKAKNLLKKLWKVKLGDIPLKIIIEDPSGNSTIVSEKSKVEKLK